jgi:hypothetical protein
VNCEDTGDLEQEINIIRRIKKRLVYLFKIMLHIRRIKTFRSAFQQYEAGLPDYNAQASSEFAVPESPRNEKNDLPSGRADKMIIAAMPMLVAGSA